MNSQEEKIINFSISELRIGNHIFRHTMFDTIKDREKDVLYIKNEILSATIINKSIIEDRFVIFDFEFYEKYPYPPEVLKIDKMKGIKKTSNPRSSKEIEPKSHLFTLIDLNTQKIYLSDRRKAEDVIRFFEKYIDEDILIVPIIEEKDFLENVERIGEISLTVVRNNLFNASATLSQNLAEDIHYFGADEISLSMRYKKGIHVNDVKEKIGKIMNNRFPYKKLTIIGRKANSLETIFNLDGIVNRISVKAPLEKETMDVIPNLVFETLILKIKQNEKTK